MNALNVFLTDLAEYHVPQEDGEMRASFTQVSKRFVVLISFGQKTAKHFNKTLRNSINYLFSRNFITDEASLKILLLQFMSKKNIFFIILCKLKYVRS